MTETKTLQPLFDRIIVLPDEPDLQSAGSHGAKILLSERHAKPKLTGTAVAVGPGRRSDSGVLLPMSIQEGDRVVFGQFAGTDLEFEGETYRILVEDDVLAKI